LNATINSLNTFEFSLGTTVKSNRVNRQRFTEAGLVELFTTHDVRKEKDGPCFSPGTFHNNVRNTDHLELLGAIVLDLDQYVGSVNDLELHLEEHLTVSSAVYSTSSHTVDCPRVRVVVFPNRALTAEEYPIVSRAIASDLGLSFDSCSFTPASLYYLPTVQPGRTPFTMRIEKPLLDIDELLDKHKVADSRSNQLVAIDEDAFTEDDIDKLPINISINQIKALLACYPAEGLEYESWLEVGMALHHQFSGSMIGYDYWLSWSSKSSKHDEGEMLRKWRSFK